MATAGIITALLALVVVPSLLGNGGNTARQFGGRNTYLMIILWSQKITLTVGGAISCWRAVRRERELNTWDFQRITRLSPLELAVGKLFGAPALSYFVTLCLIPPAILSATTTSSMSLEFLLQSYVLLFTSTVVIHAFALMISTISDKGGAVSGVVLLLMLQIFPLFGWFVYLGARSSAQNFRNAQALQFYGVVVPSTALWAMLELGFAAWILLAVVRNIKADLEAMQLFTVWQGIGLAVYCNFVWIGFYPWRTTWNATSFGPLLLFSAVLFYLVGIGVLQSRELIRRRLREAGTPRLEDAKLLAPIVSLLIGAAVTQDPDPDAGEAGATAAAPDRCCKRSGPVDSSAVFFGMGRSGPVLFAMDEGSAGSHAVAQGIPLPGCFLHIDVDRVPKYAHGHPLR